MIFNVAAVLFVSVKEILAEYFDYILLERYSTLCRISGILLSFTFQAEYYHFFTLTRTVFVHEQCSNTLINHCKGEPYRFSCQRYPSVQLDRRTVTHTQTSYNFYIRIYMKDKSIPTQISSILFLNRVSFLKKLSFRLGNYKVCYFYKNNYTLNKLSKKLETLQSKFCKRFVC